MSKHPWVYNLVKAVRGCEGLGALEINKDNKDRKD